MTRSPSEQPHAILRREVGLFGATMFLCAKTASAATAALGFSGYVLNALAPKGSGWLVPLALAIVMLLTLLVLGGIRRSSNSNMAVVSVTLFSLIVFVLAGLPTTFTAGTTHLQPFFAPVSGSGRSLPPTAQCGIPMPLGSAG